jgi:hypothetical protein
MTTVVMMVQALALQSDQDEEAAAREGGAVPRGRLLLRRGRAHAAAGQLSDALVDYQAAARLDPSNQVRLSPTALHPLHLYIRRCDIRSTYRGHEIEGTYHTTINQDDQTRQHHLHHLLHRCDAIGQ